MSTDAYLWDPESFGLPQTYEEAAQIYLKLSDGVKTTSNHKLIQFGEKIDHWLKSNPDLSDYLHDEFEQTLKFTQQNERALFIVGMPYYDDMEALRQVVQFANESGLVVFSESASMVFLPNRKIFPVSKIEMWHGVLDYLDDPNPAFPRTLSKFNKLVLPQLVAMAERHGMQKTTMPFWINNEGYVRKIGNNEQYFAWRVTGSGGEYKISIILYVMNHLALEIYNKFAFKKQAHIELVYLLGSLSRQYQDYYEEITNKFGEITDHQTLNAALRFFEDFAFAKILDVAGDIKGLDDLMNNEHADHILRKSLSFPSPRNLIVARLANNPNFEELIKKGASNSDWNAIEDAKKIDLPELLKYLRSEVTPLL